MCIICDRWSRTPFAKRHTTPTTAQDVESGIVLGFWISQHLPEDQVTRLCERHSNYMFQLDAIEAANQAAVVAPPTEQQLAFQERALAVAQKLSAPLPQAAQSPLTPANALVGPGPEPSPPAAAAPGNPQPSQPVPGAPVPEVPTEKPWFPCPICHQRVTTGDLHRCEG